MDIKKNRKYIIGIEQDAPFVAPLMPGVRAATRRECASWRRPTPGLFRSASRTSLWTGRTPCITKRYRAHYPGKFAGQLAHSTLSIRFDARTVEDYFTQFSICKAGIRINSFSLLVMRVLGIESAWAAISISREPMGLPCFSKLALRSP